MHTLDRLAALLDGDSAVPDTVHQTSRLLKQLGVWHQFSRNPPALSCQDAARKRNRLGHQGIPLWDELKSYLGRYRRTDGTWTPFLAHSRGDRELDLDKVRLAVGSPANVERQPLDDLGLSDVAYGTVNPFLLSELVQVFDHELMRSMGTPGTIMTNAGDHTWAVEFDCGQLVSKLPHAKWADIVDSGFSEAGTGFWGVRVPESIGILTGNPLDSGLDLCHALNVSIRKLLGRNSLGDVSMPKVIVLSLPQIGISMEMDIRGGPLRKALLDGVDELCKSGAKIIAHPAHTTHYFAPEIRERVVSRGGRFVSLVDVLSHRIQVTGVREIALLGTRFVTDFSVPGSLYHDAFPNVIVHKPSQDGWRKIHEIAYEVQQTGPNSKCFNLMRDLLREEVPASCSHVVLAMTEFTPIIKQLKERGRQGKILIDPMDFYGEALAREYLGLASLDSHTRIPINLEDHNVTSDFE